MHIFHTSLVKEGNLEEKNTQSREQQIQQKYEGLEKLQDHSDSPQGDNAMTQVQAIQIGAGR